MRWKCLWPWPLLLVALFASCSKNGKVNANDSVSSAEEYTVNIRIKSNRMSANNQIADDLARLDLYLFHSRDKKLDEHIVLTPDNSGSASIALREKTGERVGILVYGNLDEDTADYFAGKTLSELADYSSSNKVIFSAGNFSPDRIPMVGSGLYTFNNDGAIDINLYRLMSRIEVGMLKIDFENQDIVGKEVAVKNIIIGNAMNYFPALSSNELGLFNSTSIHIGRISNLTDAFGGVKRGFEWRNSFFDNMAIEQISPDGDGQMSGSYPRLLNNNYKKSKGVLIADASGEMGKATIQRYDNAIGEGMIVAKGDMSSPHMFTINRAFYTFFGSLGWPKEILCDYDKQGCTQKLIIELSINGKPYFYPIELKDTQPNTVYKIDTITIKNLGSEYSNFYEKQYSLNFTIGVSDWYELEIGNYNVGIDVNTGEMVNP